MVGQSRRRDGLTVREQVGIGEVERRAVRPALEVRDLRDPASVGRCGILCRRRRDMAFVGRAGRDGVYRRRVRVRQVDDGTCRSCGFCPTARDDRARRDHRSMATTCCAVDQRAIEDLRGDAIAMIFQEPLTALNPVMTIGDQIAEGVRQHRARRADGRASAPWRRSRLVRMPDPERRAAQYPHQLSGGMRQRAMIALALACEPRIIVADEPTTALDVTIQAQILGLIADLQRRLGTALLLITHDLGVVSEIADRVIVMYAGRRVEEASVYELFDEPLHPYTIGADGCDPAIRARASAAGSGLPTFQGAVPPMWDLPPGCAFAPRCPRAVGALPRRSGRPSRKSEPGHFAACWEVAMPVG